MTDPVDPHPGETWADVGLRRLGAELPAVQVPRGGISYPTHWDMVDAELARLPWASVVEPGAELQAGDLGVWATGGWCAPVSAFYDLVDRTPWTHADLPLWWDTDVDAWLFPRLAAAARAWAGFRRRCAAARAAFLAADIDPEDGW